MTLDEEIQCRERQIRDLDPETWQLVRLLAGVVDDARHELDESGPMGRRIDRADAVLRRDGVQPVMRAVERRRVAEMRDLRGDIERGLVARFAALPAGGETDGE